MLLEHKKEILIKIITDGTPYQDKFFQDNIISDDKAKSLQERILEFNGLGVAKQQLDMIGDRKEYLQVLEEAQELTSDAIQHIHLLEKEYEAVTKTDFIGCKKNNRKKAWQLIEEITEDYLIIHAVYTKMYRRPTTITEMKSWVEGART